MGIFGGKDKMQDKQLKEVWKWLQALNKNQAQIIKNQNILIKNNNTFIEKNKKQAELNKNQQALMNHISSLEKTIEAMKEKDKQFAAMFQNLATVTTEAVKKEEG